MNSIHALRRPHETHPQLRPSARIRSVRAQASPSRRKGLHPAAVSHQYPGRNWSSISAGRSFRRRNRRVEMTSEGGVSPKAWAACSRRDRGHVRRNRARAACAGARRHCAPSFAVKWLGPRLPECHTGASGRIRSACPPVPEPIDLTRTHESSVAIVVRHHPRRPGIVAQALGAERIVALCAPSLVREGVPSAEQDRQPRMIGFGSCAARDPPVGLVRAERSRCGARGPRSTAPRSDLGGGGRHRRRARNHPPRRARTGPRRADRACRAGVFSRSRAATAFLSCRANGRNTDKAEVLLRLAPGPHGPASGSGARPRAQA